MKITMNKATLGILFFVIIALIVIIVLITFNSNKNDKINSEVTVENDAEPASKTTSNNEESEYENQVKVLVEEQFEYFDSIVNGTYFVHSRKNGPRADGTYPDDWVSEQVKEELHQRAMEIDEVLPEELNGNDSTGQSLIQVLIRINQVSSLLDTQKNVYNIYKTLYQLHVKLNDYTLEEGKFDPENEWEEVFGEEIDLSVKTEEEIMELLESEE